MIDGYHAVRLGCASTFIARCFHLHVPEIWETEQSVCMMDTVFLLDSQQSVAHQLHMRPNLRPVECQGSQLDVTVYGVVGHEIHPSIAMCSGQFPW